MPVRVKAHTRRNRRRGEEPLEPQEAKVIVYTPVRYEETPKKPTLREKIKRDFKIPKKPKRAKTSVEKLADDADRLADALEKVEEG